MGEGGWDRWDGKKTGPQELADVSVVFTCEEITRRVVIPE